MSEQEHDGIRELDNVLPNWWVQILWGTVVFAICYWCYDQVFAASERPVAAYQRERMALAEAEAEKLKAQGELTDERLEAMAKNAAIVAAGKATFTATCAPCHRADAGGQVGPNLTDEYWLHGGKAIQIAADVRNGFVDKGMPAWGPQLGENKVREVAAYVVSLRGSHVPGGKEPQGEKE
jgi:cytochrome c oxidase cbb3-type subunit 3